MQAVTSFKIADQHRHLNKLVFTLNHLDVSAKPPLPHLRLYGVPEGVVTVFLNSLDVCIFYRFSVSLKPGARGRLPQAATLNEFFGKINELSPIYY